MTITNCQSTTFDRIHSFRTEESPILPLTPEQLLACHVGQDIRELKDWLESDEPDIRRKGCQMVAIALKEDRFGPTITLKLLIALDPKTRMEYMSQQFDSSVQAILQEELTTTVLAARIIGQLIKSSNTVDTVVAFALWKEYCKANIQITKALFHKCITHKCFADLAMRIYQLHGESGGINSADKIRILIKITPHIDSETPTRLRSCFIAAVNELPKNSCELQEMMAKLLERTHEIEIEGESLNLAAERLARLRTDSQLSPSAFRNLSLKFVTRTLVAHKLDEYRQSVIDSLGSLANQVDEQTVQLYCKEVSLRMRCGKFDTACREWLEKHPERVDWLSTNEQVEYAHRCYITRKPIPPSIDLRSYLLEKTKGILSSYELELIHDCIDLFKDEPVTLIAIAKQQLTSNKDRAFQYLRMAIRAKAEVSEDHLTLILSLIENRSIKIDELKMLCGWVGNFLDNNPQWRKFLHQVVLKQQDSSFLVQIIVNHRLISHVTQDLPKNYQSFMTKAMEVIERGNLTEDQCTTLYQELNQVQGYSIPDSIKSKLRAKMRVTTLEVWREFVARGSMATHEPSKVIEVTIPFLGQLKTEDRNTLKNVLERKVALKNEDMNELTKSIKLCISVEDPLLFECAICYLKRMTEFYLGLKEIDPKLKIEEWQLSKIPKTTRLLFDLVYEALTSFKPESLHDGFQTALCNFVITCRAYPRSKMDGLHMLELLPYDQYKEMVPFSHFIWLMTEGIRHRVPTGPQEMDVSALRPTLNRYKEVVLRIMNAFDEHGVEHRPTFMNICRVNLLTVVLEPHEFLPYYIHYATLLPSTNPSPLMNETIEYLGLILPIIDSAMNQPNIAHIILKVVLMLNAYENPSTRQMKNVYINRFLKLEARDPSLDIQYCIMEKLPSDLLSSDEVFISLCEITRRASEYQSYEYVSYALSLFKYWTSKKKFKPKQIIQLFNAFIGFQVKVDHGNIVRGGIRLADEISMALPELLNELEPAEKREFWSELIESIFSRGDTSNISRIGLISLCLKGASECFRGEHRPKFLSHVETLVEKVLQIPEFPPHSVFSIFICIQNVISLKDLTTEEKDATLQITTMLRSMLATYNTTHPGGAKLLEQLDWTN